MLENETAKKLYHGYAANMPIIDYHCYLSPKDIAEDRIFNSITEAFLSVCKQMMIKFPHAKKVITTLEGSISASHNTWAGVLYNGEKMFESRQYQITDIVDRVGGGDSFMGGLIYGLLKYSDDEQNALDFAVASNPNLKDAARIELGLRAFLESGGFGVYTNTFEDLHGFKQLPGIASQRLMTDGYGFGAEGDWKTSALLHACKVMDQGLEGGTSFMEDYTYDFRPDRSRVLGSHMLEICPTIAIGKPRVEIHALGIGGKDDPARLVFDVDSGDAINASLIDMGNRFRLLVSEVEAVKPDKQLPNLPVARVLWDPKPNLEIAAGAWILAGGAHHTVFSKAINTAYFEDFADMAGIELVVIDEETRIRDFKEKLRWNEVYCHLFQNNL